MGCKHSSAAVHLVELEIPPPARSVTVINMFTGTEQANSPTDTASVCENRGMSECECV